MYGVSKSLCQDIGGKKRRKAEKNEAEKIEKFPHRNIRPSTLRTAASASAISSLSDGAS
jgi:hypothetical protein